MTFDSYSDGYCPQCALNNEEVEMSLNQGDYWECPVCHLQAAGSNAGFMILRVRGAGTFKSHKVSATEYISGAFVTKQSLTDPFESDGWFQDEVELRRFIENEVGQNEDIAIQKEEFPMTRVEDFCTINPFEMYTRRPDGIIDVNGDVKITQSAGTTIPIRFGKVAGSFNCAHTQLKSLQGAPEIVGGYFSCCATKITSLSGVDKLIKNIDGEFLCNSNVTHILGLLLIKGITKINVDNGGPIDKIMNKYIGTGDILSAQDELLDAGFKDQARL
ncbi:MAG TPA: hypothetical protein VIH90_00055 [Candidatus Saccharimonadales bacterium]